MRQGVHLPQLSKRKNCSSTLTRSTTQVFSSQISSAPEPSETFKLARAIETPIAQRKPQAVKPPTLQPVAKKVQQPPKAAPEAPKPALTKGTVNKRETTQTVGEAGEAQFQRAAAFLRQGRVSEAEEQLRGALQAVFDANPRVRDYVLDEQGERLLLAAMRLFADQGFHKECPEFKREYDNDDEVKRLLHQRISGSPLGGE